MRVEEAQSKEKKALDRRVKVLGFASFFNDTSSEMIYPFLPVFITKYLGVGPAFVGIIEGIAESTSSFLKLLSGWLSDRMKGRKVLVSIGYSLPALTRPLISFVSSWLPLLGLRFIDRFGKGVRTSPRDSIIADSVDGHSRGRAFGFQRAMDNLGAVCGPLVSFLILKLIVDDIRKVFLLSLIPSIFVLILVVFVLRDVRRIRLEKTELSLRLKGFSSSFKLYLLSLLFFTLGNSSDSFLFLKASEAKISVEFLPLLWVGHNIVKATLSYPFGKLSDRVERRKIIILGWLIYALIYTGFAFSENPFLILLLFILYGSVFGITEGAERAYVADVTPPEHKGTAYGLFHFIQGVALFPASFITGLLWQTLDSKFALLYGALMAGIASTIILNVKERREV
ncbi:MAG: MFS transporter [Candidatus Aminicenantia bacterium]